MGDHLFSFIPLVTGTGKSCFVRIPSFGDLFFAGQKFGLCGGNLPLEYFELDCVDPDFIESV